MKRLVVFLLLLLSIFVIYYTNYNSVSYDLNDIPDYNGDKYIVINNNIPNFTKKELNKKNYEKYSDLDKLGRCGTAFANIGIEMMPTKERESIGMIKPSGWRISKYDFIDGEYLFNRCHLIAYMLTGQNANEKNLITCTREMNSVVMLEFELKVANYIRRTNNHVAYRVTPIFDGDNLLAKGVQMEAKSVEDNEIEFNVFIYNVQDNIEIDYSNGDNILINENKS